MPLSLSFPIHKVGIVLKALTRRAQLAYKHAWQSVDVLPWNNTDFPPRAVSGRRVECLGQMPVVPAPFHSCHRYLAFVLNPGSPLGGRGMYRSARWQDFGTVGAGRKESSLAGVSDLEWGFQPQKW
jgi:hypothetical protein